MNKISFEYPCKDLANTKQIFSKFLGMEPFEESDNFAEYKVGDMKIRLLPKSSQFVTWIDVADIRDVRPLLQEMIALGATVVEHVHNEGRVVLLGKVKDNAGNVIGVRHDKFL